MASEGVPQLGVLVGPDDWTSAGAADRVVSLARVAADHGLRVAVGEHASRPGYAPSALALAAVLVASLPGASVLTSAVIAGVRTPASLLRDAEVIARAAGEGGGFALGVVAGYDPADFAGDDARGRFEQLDELVAAFAVRRPCPVFVGGGSEAAVGRATQVDGWLAPTHAELESIRAAASALRLADPTGRVLVVRRWVSAPDGDELRRRPQPPDSRTPQHLLVGGGPDRLRSQLEELSFAGADDVVLGPLSHADQLSALLAELRGAEVVG